MRRMSALLLALGFSGFFAMADNPLKNPGFESASDWSSWGFHDAVPAGERKNFLTYDTSKAASGKASLKLADLWTTGRPYAVQFFDVTAPVPGYEMTFKACGKAGSAIRAGMQFGKMDGKAYHFISGDIRDIKLKSDDWNEYKIVIRNIPAAATRYNVALAPTSGDLLEVNTVWFDDVALRPLTAAELAPAAKAPAAQTGTVADRLGKAEIGLRDYHYNTALVADGKTVAMIVIPAGDEYRKLAAAVNAAVKAATGETLPVVEGSKYRDSTKLPANLIMLGNRDDNPAISNLYMRHYVILDAKYPGAGGGSVVRSLHNPFGDGKNVIFAGGSDFTGTGAAVEKLASLIRAQKAGKSLSLGYLAEIKLGPNVKIPEIAAGCELWEQSQGYGKRGYFGWNTLSRNLALLYLTGEKRYATEFMRLALPKDEATGRELFKLDDESYRDNMNPLGDPYHYRSIMTMLFWDLVEESPAFSDADRLAITKKFYEQLVNRLLIKDYFNIYRFAGAGPLKILPDRHLLWEAMTVYVTARYFDKYYPGIDSSEGLRLARNAMGTLDQYAAIEVSSLFWYNTFIQPLFVYAALEGGEKYVNSPVLKAYTEGLAALSDRRGGDWSQSFSSPAFLMLAAYLTKDQAPIELMKKTGVDDGNFKAGQSFYPAKPYADNFFERTAGKWYAFQSDSRGMRWSPPFDVSKVVEWMAYRQTPGPDGDYLLLDTKYGPGGRVPFHNFNILTFRLNGDTLLRGYFNQLALYADGLNGMKSSDYSEIIAAGKLGDTIYVRAKLSDYNGFDWYRTLLLRENRFLLVYDEVVPLDNLQSVEVINSFLPAPGSSPKLVKNGEVQFTPPSSGALPLSDKLFCHKPGPQLLEEIEWRNKSYSASNYAIFDTVSPGTVLKLNFDLPKAVDSNVVIRLGSHEGRRGKVRFLLDGKVLMKEFDHINPGGFKVVTVDLGKQKLAAGRHVLEIEALTVDPAWPNATLIGLEDFRVADFDYRPPAKSYLLGTSFSGDPVQTPVEGGTAVEFVLERDGKKGQPIRFATLLAPGVSGDLPLAADAGDGKIALSLPAMLEARDGGFILREEKRLTGFLVREIPGVFVSDNPVIAVLTPGSLEVIAPENAALRLADGNIKACNPGEIVKIAAPLPPANLDGVVAALKAKVPAAKPAFNAPAWNAAFTVKAGYDVSRFIQVGENIAVTAGNKALLIGRDGKVLREFPAASAIGAIAFVPKTGELLLGCKDEKLLAFTLDGTKKWEFTSVMSDGLIATNQFYWFKTAVPGINAIAVAEFEAGKPLIFVGSTSTVEILDTAGNLIKRERNEYGRVNGFTFVPASDGKPARMLAYRQNGGWPRVFGILPDLSVVDMQMTRGTDDTDMGSYGYSSVGRNFIVASPLKEGGPVELVGDFNGALNRVGIWNRDGRIVRDINFGPGFRADTGMYGREALRGTNVRGLAVADLDNNGSMEIAVAYNRSRLFIFDRDLKLMKLVKLPSNPTLLTTVETGGAALLAVGCFDGSLFLVNGKGEILRQAKFGGAVSALNSANAMVYAGFLNGDVVALKAE